MTLCQIIKNSQILERLEFGLQNKILTIFSQFYDVAASKTESCQQIFFPHHLLQRAFYHQLHQTLG